MWLFETKWLRHNNTLRCVQPLLVTLTKYVEKFISFITIYRWSVTLTIGRSNVISFCCPNTDISELFIRLETWTIRLPVWTQVIPLLIKGSVDASEFIADRRRRVWLFQLNRSQYAYCSSFFRFIVVAISLLCWLWAYLIKISIHSFVSCVWNFWFIRHI